MELLKVKKASVSRFPSKCDSLDRKFNLTLNQNATPKDLLKGGLFMPLLRMSLMTRLRKWDDFSIPSKSKKSSKQCRMLYGFKLPQKKRIKWNRSHLSSDVRDSFKSKKQKKLKFQIKLNSFKLDFDGSILKHKGTLPFKRNQKLASEWSSSLNFYKMMTAPTSQTVKKETDVDEMKTRLPLIFSALKSPKSPIKSKMGTFYIHRSRRSSENKASTSIAFERVKIPSFSA